MIVKRDPIAALIAQAAQAPPPPPPPPRLKATKATKAAPVVVLLDTSGSMAQAADGGSRRIDVLRNSLDWALSNMEHRAENACGQPSILMLLNYKAFLLASQELS